MTDKFTYIDFLMYVIPGAFLVSVFVLSVCLFFPDIITLFDNEIVSGAIFIVLSFVVGNFVQVYSHLGPEDRLKKEYWHGYYPSQVMFFPKNKVINEKERLDLIKACQATGILSDEDADCFKDETLNKFGISCANKCFNYMRVYLADSGKGSRIRGSEGYFLFFRGLFVASFWSAILMALVFAFNLICKISPDIQNLIQKQPPSSLIIMIPLFLAVVFLIFWRTFRYRCRGAAQGFAREVYRAYCANLIIKEGGNG